jgi:hypothetical protein
MSADDFLLDAGIRHQIFVQRYAGGQVKELLGYLRDMVADVERKLIEAQTLPEAQRLTRQLQEIQRIIDDGLERMSNGLLESTADLAEYEAEFAVRTLNTAATVEATLPRSEILRALVTTKPMATDNRPSCQDIQPEEGRRATPGDSDRIRGRRNGAGLDPQGDASVQTATGPGRGASQDINQSYFIRSPARDALGE